MSQWPYPYCPHQSYNKNIQIRLASIPYTFVPDPTIDAFTNVNVKCGNLTKYNIPTLAYENYFQNKKESDNQRNFAKHFYMNQNQEETKLDNNIVNQQKQEMALKNAYALAAEAADSYNKFQTNRKNALSNARQRAMTTYKSHFAQIAEEKNQLQQQNAQWLKKLYRKLEQIAKHIVEGDGQDLNEKQRMFLLSKGSLTAKFLSEIKIRNPKSAFEILEEIRILMLKKKLKFQDQREEQNKNKSVSMSYTSQASQNTSKGSMLSQATSVNQSNIDGQQQLVAKFCDFSTLKKRWRVDDVDQVKYLLRFMMTRKFVSEAELNAVKKREEAIKINKSLSKNNILKEKSQSKTKIKSNLKARSKSVKVINSNKIPKESDTKYIKQNVGPKISKQELLVKQKLLKGGQFDAIGQKFSRNNNYANLFNKKQKQLNFTYSVKQEVTKIGAKTIIEQKTNRPESTLNLNDS